MAVFIESRPASSSQEKMHSNGLKSAIMAPDTTPVGTADFGAVETSTNAISRRIRKPPTATLEQKMARLEKARQLRAERAASLRSNFHPDDEKHWRELAARYGVRLPAYGLPVTTAAMKRWLHRLGISIDEYMANEGAGLDGNGTSARLTDFIVRNTSWPLKAWVGLLLEQIDLGHLTVSEVA